MTCALAGSAVVLAIAGGAARVRAQAAADDPYLWLEEKDGAKPLAWVAAENARTLRRLESDARYPVFLRQAQAIAAAKDRIAAPNQQMGRITNFWRDAAHPLGVWRWTTPASYATATPQWTTLIDLDALSAKEGKKWVWSGATCLQPEERHCLIGLSEGGEDAVTFREFDLATGAFVPGGFVLPRSKQDASWIDKDTIAVARDWGSGSLTVSGYPFVVKKVARGQPLAAAVEFYRGAPSDQIGTYTQTLSDGAGNKALLIQRYTTIFSGDTLLGDGDGRGVPVKLDIPPRVSVTGMVDGQVLFKADEAWGAIPAGAIAAAPLAAVRAGRFTPQLVFAPGPRQSVDGVATTRNRMLATVYDNVRGRVLVFAHGAGGWSHRTLELPDNASISVASTSHDSDLAYLSVTGFLTPGTLWSVDAAGAADPVEVKATPPRFDASTHVVDQFEAVSSDGVKIPYFVVHARQGARDGGTPTIMNAYGGFAASMTPSYLGITGKLWLERGGSFVLANIRGGGEFGPAWHDAGRKTKRQIIYDDFAAVAKDLFARKLTSPARLGIYGGSNGGLLMGVEFVQHPELWGAVVIQVPLLDMLRYEKIAAGPSWVDEYGSVDVPAERAFLTRISPYANVKRGVAYPEPFIWTNTSDDRVGPQHARKFAARLKEFGLPYLYYEDMAGGHSGNSDISQAAKMDALEMTYFSQKLMDAKRP
jgi:prolyl oligopeptidase